MSAVLRKLADGYHERPTRSLGTRHQDGHVVKLYAVEAPGRHVDAAHEQAALRLLDGSDGDGDATGLAVVIVHAGADGDYVVIQSWLADYLTRLAVFAGPAGEPLRLRPAPPGLGPCVWEAAVLAHERAAFVDHVLTGSGPVEDRVRAWADDVLGHVRTSPWSSAEPMRGDHVILEPLDLAHVPDLLTATADDEVWQHLHLRRPANVEEMAAIVAEALGTRVPWVQRDARTGAVAGTTSYYDISEERGSVAIGHTIIGRPWWRTGLNTEAKLLLLTRAFDELSAERVEWHVDTDNERSQQAVLRLGATREGVIRHHHRRQSDGSLRDLILYSMTADEWPDARTHLESLLRSG
jgi:RimJ/RimL family protein N-acetyltransferase